MDFGLLFAQRISQELHGEFLVWRPPCGIHCQWTLEGADVQGVGHITSGKDGTAHFHKNVVNGIRRKFDAQQRIL